ncbi:MAG: RNA methyltransferase [Pseudomonadota bacterium]|nr:RNA methyltransferase [Pseudomonadota bacterium]
MKAISSRDNPVYKELLALAGDRRARRQSGRTLLDGPHLLQAGLEAGATFRRLVFSETAAAGPLADWRRQLPEIPACVLPDALFNALAPVDTPVGLIGVIDIPQALDSIQGDCIVLLENIQDPGNLGAILRVAAAAGVDAVHLSQGCCEAWSPKCLRGGQGAHFQSAICENADLPMLAQAFGGPVYAASLGGRVALFDLDLCGPVGFAFGNEGAGLSAQLCAAAQPFIIPMPGKVESLNVATAAAVCLFERVRQQR